MPRMSSDEVTAVVTSAIQNAGGRIAYNDLLAQLQSQGQQQAIDALLPLARSRVVIAEVIAQGEDLPAQLIYSLPGA